MINLLTFYFYFVYSRIIYVPLVTVVNHQLELIFESHLIPIFLKRVSFSVQVYWISIVTNYRFVTYEKWILVPVPHL